MKRRLSTVLLAFLILGPLAINGGCSSSSSTSDDGSSDGSGNGGSGGSGSTQPTLTSADFPDVSPCSDRDTLPADTTFLSTVTNATSVLHIHRVYSDDNSIPVICGLEGAWDPTAITGSNERRENNTFEENLSSYFSGGMAPNQGTFAICRSGFGFTGSDVSGGLPSAGTYRGEACIESGGNAYRTRLRVTVSGNDAGKKFSEIGLMSEADLTVYDANSKAVSTKTEAKSLVTGSPAEFSFTLRSGNGANTHLNAKVQVICIKKLATACPAASS
ncbi:MAG: hypothetical protein HYS22_03110 [Deltaproteobacteria bacterium]|nr:hypothetical protein [Deltaproteobacteria bacterium]